MRSVSLSLLLVCGALPGLGQARAQSYTFTTIAGQSGVVGAVDGTNSDARFNYPAGLALGEDGALYVTDLLNNTVRKLTPLGTNWVVTTLAGMALVRASADGTNSDARFNRPAGIAVDLEGNLFVADKYNNTIRKMRQEGTNWIVTTIAGTAGVQAGEDGTNGAAHFWGPADVALDRFNRLYVADSSNHTIRRIAPEGTNWVVTTLAGTALWFGFEDGTNGDAAFNYPYGVTVDGSGTVYVADWGNYAIRQVTPAGKDWVTTTVSGFSGLMGTNDGSGATASFDYPTGIAVDAQTNIFVTDYESHVVRKISRDGPEWIVSTIGGAPLQFGSADGTGDAARFYRPWGIAVDRAGNLFVADYRNQTIRKGTPLVPPLPILEFALAGGQLVLGWSTTLANYQLEMASEPGGGAVWTPITNDVVLSGDTFVYTNASPSAAGFYRLRLKPLR